MNVAYVYKHMMGGYSVNKAYVPDGIPGLNYLNVLNHQRVQHVAGWMTKEEALARAAEYLLRGEVDAIREYEVNVA